MIKQFKEIAPESIDDNIFKLIGTDWMLVTAGERNKFNMMTASWGGIGVMWGKKIAWCVIRPHRYTYEFVERANIFTLSFFDEKYRNLLNLCGSKSGRDVDKVKATGLTPVVGSSNGVYFAEARLVIECRKIYFQDIDPKNFIDPSISANYPEKDYHRMYVGEIVTCMKKTVNVG